VHSLWAAALESRGPILLSAAPTIAPGELDSYGFVLFVQLMEEQRLEKEIAVNYGVLLVDGPVMTA
jgi:hypothetical protein